MQVVLTHTLGVATSDKKKPILLAIGLAFVFCLQ